MSLDFIDKTSQKLGIDRKDMVEKDVLLHQILTNLSKDKFFSKNFIFKGGTCLIKNYLGYFRFTLTDSNLIAQEKNFNSLLYEYVLESSNRTNFIAHTDDRRPQLTNTACQRAR